MQILHLPSCWYMYMYVRLAHTVFSSILPTSDCKLHDCQHNLICKPSTLIFTQGNIACKIVPCDYTVCPFA